MEFTQVVQIILIIPIVFIAIWRLYFDLVRSILDNNKTTKQLVIELVGYVCIAICIIEFSLYFTISLKNTNKDKYEIVTERFYRKI